MITNPKKLKKKRFFFHFNKPMTLKAGTPKMSVHFDNKCLIVDEIICNVNCQSKINKRQPRVVMQGYATSCAINEENNKIRVIIK